MKYNLITGTSSGLGLGLARAFLDEQNVIGLSRNKSILEKDYPAKYEHIYLDLEKLSIVPLIIQDFFEKKRHQYPIEIEYLILNSGILGEIKDLQDTSLEEIHKVMNVNLWSNKILLDTIFRLEKKKIIQGPSRILAISSGASISGNRGWNAYALSKAGLNMLIKLYAAEMPGKRFISLAPGLVHTKMQDELYNKNIDLEKYPSFKRIIEARETNNMPSSEEAAKNIFNKLDIIFSYESGSYVDIRNL